MAGPAVLHIIGGNDRGKQHQLDRPETRIGRGTDQDLVLADIAVSRRHVTIHAEGTGDATRYRLKDLGSGNGSLVNGQRVDGVILNDGDQIEIGNTLMRFDHPLSRPIAVAPVAPTPSNVAFGAPPPAYPAPYPPQAAPAPYPAAAFPPSYSGLPAEPSVVPSYAPPPVGVASGAAPSYIGPPSGRRDRQGGGSGRLVAMVVLTLISLGCIGVIISRTVAASPPLVNSEAEEFYRQGLRMFAAGDYETARIKFNDVLTLVPDSPEAVHYSHRCDNELSAKTSLKNAERALMNRRYTEAVRALDAVEPTSVYYDQAIRQRRDAAPKAAAEMVDDARRLIQDNPEEARSRLKAALDLDPENFDGRELLGRLRGGTPPSTLSVKPAAATGPPPSAATVAAVTRTQPTPRAPVAPQPKKHHTKEESGGDGELVDVKLGKEKPGAPTGAVDSKAGMAAYKARDFAGAARAYRQESTHQPEKQASKMLDFANQITTLAALVDRAAADEQKAPASAMKEYDQALQIDQRLSHGQLSGFFKQHMSGLGAVAAKQAFSEGKYDQAYQAALAAQRGGTDVSAVLKQLEQKAADLVQQGLTQQKTNLNQAKQTWRLVCKMVPASSPSYTKAYGFLNTASAPKRDEDED